MSFREPQRSPSRIRLPHAPNQTAQFGRDFGPPGRSHSAQRRRVMAKVLFLPVHHGTRLHEVQRRSPTRLKTGDDRPQKPVERRNAGPRAALLIQSKLMPQHNDFGLQRRARSKRRCEQRKQEFKKANHGLKDYRSHEKLQYNRAVHIFGTHNV